MQTSTYIAIAALGVSALSLIVSFINVNRQKTAAKKNEEEKFKRELNFKTYDEFVELLSEFTIVIRKYYQLHNMTQVMLRRTTDEMKDEGIEKLNNLTWEITESWMTSISKIKSYYIKRKIVLKNFESNLDKIVDISTNMDKDLWQYKIAVWGLYHEESMVLNITEGLSSKVDETLSIVDSTILELQNEFLGHIYNSGN